MDPTDSQIHHEWLHNQKIVLPTVQAWRLLLLEGFLDGLPIPIPDVMGSNLDIYAGYPEVQFGLVLHPTLGWFPLTLLSMQGRKYRVHLENVVCEHCNQRNGPSAQLDSSSYIGTEHSYWDDMKTLPIKACIHCRCRLQRRQIIWLAQQDSSRPVYKIL